MRLLRVLGQAESLACTDQKKALSVLRYAVMSCIQDAVLFEDVVSVITKLLDNLFEKLAMASDGQAPDVLEDKIGCLQFNYDPNEMVDERIAGVVERPFTNHAEALARSTAKNRIHAPITDARMVPDIFPVDVGYAAAEGSAAREIELVRSAMDRIVFNRRGHVESSLLEAEAHPSRSRKQIDGDGAPAIALRQTNRQIFVSLPTGEC
jgi:hypothetical protein